MQMEAQVWAKRYNRHRVPKHVYFIDSFLVELRDRPGKPLAAVEQLIPGEYVKYSNNTEWTDETR